MIPKDRGNKISYGLGELQSLIIVVIITWTVKFEFVLMLEHDDSPKLFYNWTINLGLR